MVLQSYISTKEMTTYKSPAFECIITVTNGVSRSLGKKVLKF